MACELELHGLRGLKLTRMQLVRSQELTYSALRLNLAIPAVNLTGNFRLTHLQLLGMFNARNSTGTVAAHLTGVTVQLTAVLQTDRHAKPLVLCGTLNTRSSGFCGRTQRTRSTSRTLR